MNRRTHPLEVTAAWLLALVWLAPLAYAFWSALHPAAYCDLVQPVRAVDAEELCPRLEPGAVRSLLSQHRHAGLSGAGRTARAVDARRLCLRPVQIHRQRHRLCAGAAAADDHAGRADRGELSRHQRARTARHHSRHRVALSRQRRSRIFLLRQTFKSIPQELVDAARVEGAGPLQVLWRVYIPLARPTYIAFGLVSVSYHWNNFLWPLIVTNSVGSRPLTVGLAVFGAPETGVDWSIICAATVMTMAPLLIAFLVFQRQFVQSFMRAGIR